MGLFDKIKNLLGGDESGEHAPADRVAISEAGAEGAGQTTDASALAGVDSSDILRRLAEKVSELSTGQLAVDAIDPTASLLDFGYLDSLSAVTMISFIDSEYGVSVTEIDLIGELSYLQALADRLARDRTR